MVCQALGRAPRMRAYGHWLLALAGLFDAQFGGMKEMLCQFQDPFVMNMSKFENASGDTMSYEKAIRETV